MLSSLHTRFIVVSLFIALTHSLFGQLCEGTPGNVVYTEDFGAGAANLGPPLPAGTTDYQFGQPGDGNYMVVNDAGQNGIHWHSGPDHTPGDNNGYMLLFDASPVASLFFQTTIDALCPNTSYSFSCWIANIGSPSTCGNGGIRPDLRFTILDAVTGAVLGETNTGSIEVEPTLTWVEVGITFTTPAALDAVRIEIRNNAPGGCGNDFVLDDFSFTTCNALTEQAFSICAGESVQVGTSVYTQSGSYEDIIDQPGTCNDSIVLTQIVAEGQFVYNLFRICEGDSVVVDGVTYTSPYLQIDSTSIAGSDCYDIERTEVQVGVATEVVIDTTICRGDSIRVGESTFVESGRYVNLLTSDFGCDSTVILLLEVYDFSIELQTNITELQPGDSFMARVVPNRSGDFDPVWSPADWVSCATCLQTEVAPLRDSTLQVTVTEARTGCVQTAAIDFDVLPCTRYFLPNAFSPNDDGRNDCFQLFAGSCVARITQLAIYDRWGALHYRQEANDGSWLCWDGTRKGQPANTGIYLYHAELEFIDGTRRSITGDVLLLR